MELLQQIKDFLIPELEAIRLEQQGVRERLGAIERHLVDQSRRIDETNQRIDAVREELTIRIDAVSEKLASRIDNVHADLLMHNLNTNGKIDRSAADMILRLDRLGQRLDHIFADAVRQQDHLRLEENFRKRGSRVRLLEEKLAG